jgi:hypothetical protein
MKASFFGAMVVCLMGAAVSAASAAPINVGGYSFASSADSLISSQGSFTFTGSSLASSLTDLDPGTYAYSEDAGAAVTLGFSSGIANLGGADLVLFELGTPDTFKVTINGVTLDYVSASTGFSAGGFDLNASAIDLSSFGLASGASISSVLIGLDTPNTDNGTVPSLSFAGVLNAANTTAVPEPISLSVFGAGFLGATMLRRHKAKKA